MWLQNPGSFSYVTVSFVLIAIVVGAAAQNRRNIPSMASVKNICSANDGSIRAPGIPDEDVFELADEFSSKVFRKFRALVEQSSTIQFIVAESADDKKKCDAYLDGIIQMEKIGTQYKAQLNMSVRQFGDDFSQAQKHKSDLWRSQINDVLSYPWSVETLNKHANSLALSLLTAGTKPQR